MIPTVLAVEHPETAAAVDLALETGRTLIVPTDTVYGIGGNPWDQRTLSHVRRLKQRGPSQPFTLHRGSTAAIATYAELDARASNAVSLLLPGAYTILLPPRAAAPPSTVLDGKIGIRVPNHAFFRDVLRRPLFATSVNAHGKPPLNDVADIIETFTEVDLIVTGAIVGEPSAILDLTSTPIRVLRGHVPDDLLRRLEEE